MRTTTRWFFWLSLTFCLVIFVSFGFANSEAAQEAPKQIEIRLTPKAQTIRVGETLEVRVEIWNVGRKEVFIEKSLYEPCMRSPLSFYLDGGPPLNLQEPGQACAADCLDDPGETITSRLVKRWVSLPPGHFYGTSVQLDPAFFPQLRTPGRWNLHGRYSSDGELTSSVCMNNIVLDREQTEKLPYKSWKGEEDANIVRIEVVQPHQSGQKRN
jgi:hypothetical protein